MNKPLKTMVGSLVYFCIYMYEMPPKQVKSKKLFSNIAKSHFFRFLILSFSGGILSLRQKFAFLKSA